MKAGVIGLGTEGIKSVITLREYNWEVYATDLNKDIDTSDISSDKHIQIELGKHDFNKLEKMDAVLLSPSLWNLPFAQKIKKTTKLLPDVLNSHRKLFTIGVTGTNGKTTTCHMIYEILNNAGLKVLLGGNAGGGFNGYNQLFLEADKNKDYDILLVEVCDMTTDYCDYCFDFDLIVLTNMGNDHMDSHGSMEGYKENLKKFFKNKSIIINEEYTFFKQNTKNTIIYPPVNYDLNCFGLFNKLNAGAAEAVAHELNIKEDIIKNTLTNFTPVEGRLKKYNYKDAEVYIGKSDNVDALKAILDEVDFQVVFIGTPRAYEDCRWEILEEIVKRKIPNLILFNGLENTIDTATSKLKTYQFQGKLDIASNIDEIIRLLDNYKNLSPIFIGGNGQETILKIQKRLDA